jgi:DNA-directed RNA polymerase alpha subunit
VEREVGERFFARPSYAERIVSEGLAEWPADDTVDIDEILPDHVADRLKRAGYDTASDLKRASDAALLGVRGVGQSRLEDIRAALEE